jgi:glycosyltransferase involved in cell wall biosynthesis
MSSKEFSVLMSVYREDNPNQVDEALESIFTQTLVPTEVVVVADGPLTHDVNQILEKYKLTHSNKLRVIPLKSNQGLGAALRVGVKACSYDLIARMDADDISSEDRFEHQINYFYENPQTDVLGSYVKEFVTDPTNSKQIRSVPTDPKAVESIAKFRCPVNHPSAMFRRNSVLDAGNYRPLRGLEDYELWVRMLDQGYIISNLPRVLVKCRAGKELYERRGGLEYAKDELQLQQDFLSRGIITLPIFIVNIVSRIPIRLMPNRLRAGIYKTFLRE